MQRLLNVTDAVLEKAVIPVIDICSERNLTDKSVLKNITPDTCQHWTQDQKV